MFKFFYANEAEIPADQKQHYEKRDDGWYLKVEGAVARTKLDEFRTNNTTLTNEVAELKRKLKPWEDLNEKPEDVASLLSRKKDYDEANLVKKEGVDALVAQRLETAKAEHQRQIGAKDTRIGELETQLKATTGQLEKVKIDTQILQLAKERGLKEGAEPFLLNTARATWKLDDHGNPIGYDESGKILYGKDGDNMKPAEWLDNLQRKNDFMFTGNAGSGAQPANSGRQGSGAGGGAIDTNINPWKTEHLNITKQMEIYKKDPALAARMAAAAGKKLEVPAARQQPVRAGA